MHGNIKLFKKIQNDKKYQASAILAVIALLSLTYVLAYSYKYRSSDQNDSKDVVTSTSEVYDDNETVNNSEEQSTDEEGDTIPEESPTTKTDPDPTTTDNNTQTINPTPTPTPTKPSDWWAYPATILPATRNGNDLLVLVNKQYQLPSTYAPTDLVTLENVNIRLLGTHNVRSLVVSDLANLGNAAKAAGLDLSIKSSYRSYSTQASTYQYWVNYNGGNTAAADTVSARPGHSQHQLGTTVDFSSSEVNDQIGAVFNSTQAAVWLQAHAWEYGFALAYPAGAETVTGYSPEAWHYRYIGRENATAWRNSGLILEMWLRQQNGV